jgi:putative radical SAM enzyme (TIGR03279 family)
MPKGFRKSLYLKDEDIRLSFLYGHFTTLSSSDEAELDRVVRERLSPLHVSVHATDPELRARIVGNPREGHILAKIDHLLRGGISLHTQAVIVPGLNDGVAWERTVRELRERRDTGHGGILSLSCVPVGLTSHRGGLPAIPDVAPEFAREWVRRWTPEVRRSTRDNGGEPWLLLADEWFTRGGLDVPARSFYSRSWAQLENGVGLVRKFLEHSRRFLPTARARCFAGRRLLLLTGASFAPVLARTLEDLNRRTEAGLRALAVPNRAFGTSVTVAGLLCGVDLLAAAQADRKAHGGRRDWVDAVIVPSASLRTHVGPTDQYTLADGTPARPETSFLDDMTLAGLQDALGVPVLPGGANLSQLLDHLHTPLIHEESMNRPQGAYNP